MDAALPDANALFRAVDFPAGRPVVVGVSGGSDSLALLHLLAAFTRASSPGIVPVAVTVDHALRLESAAEAEAQVNAFYEQWAGEGLVGGGRG